MTSCDKLQLHPVQSRSLFEDNEAWIVGSANHKPKAEIDARKMTAFLFLLVFDNVCALSILTCELRLHSYRDSKMLPMCATIAQPSLSCAASTGASAARRAPQPRFVWAMPYPRARADCTAFQVAGSIWNSTRPAFRRAGGDVDGRRSTV